MAVNSFFVCILVLLPWFITGQIPFPHPGQYGPPVGGDMYQQHQMQQQQQIPMHQQPQQQPQINQQQPQMNQQQLQMNQQQLQMNQQQPQINQQQPQINQQQPQMNQQQQPQMNPQQPQINQQQPQINQQQPQLNQQQPQMNQQQPQLNQQQPQMNQQQPQLNQQQPQLNQQQPQMNQQQPQLNQQQPQLNQQQPQMNQQQPQLNQQQFQMNQQQPQLNQQQQYYQGNMQGPSIQNPQFMQPIQPPPFGNQFQQPTYDHSPAQIPSSPFGPNERYLVGNLSEPFSFLVAPPSIKVTYLGLNGYSLYILGMGFSNKSKFNYDEQNNRLTILSLDPTTVGYYSAVDANWQNFVNVLSAINVSSLQIHNAHASEDNNGSSLVSCSVSIIRSTFKLTEPPSSSNNLAIAPPSSLPLPPRVSTALAGTENLPRLDLFLSTRTQSSTLPNNKIYNDTLNEQVFTRTITSQRPLTRADHNGTIQCQVESNNNIDVFVIKKVPINIEYGPNLETGALPTVNLETEALRMISMDCQIEANPFPSYVWYEMITNNISTGAMSYYGYQNPYGQQQYPLQPQSNLPTAGLSVFGTTRQIQRLYQNPGQHAMECQAQSRGKSIKQDFIITVNPASGGMKGGSASDGNRGKSYKIPMIIGISIGGVLLLLLVAIIVAAVIFLKRRKTDTTEKRTTSTEKLPTEKPGKPRWGHGGNVPADYSKYKHEVLKGDSSSTSHLVESTESSTSQPPPVPNRPSPMTSRNSSYRQPPINVSLSYRQASTLPGSRPPPPPTRSYSPYPDDVDDNDSNLNTMPLTTNRSRTITPLGSRKSLTESIQSLRSNQQPALSLPVKKRSHEPPPPALPPPMVPKRDQPTPSPKSFEAKTDYQHHHYHNPAQLRAQQQRTTDNDVSSEDEELAQQQRLNNATEDTEFLPKKFTFKVRAGPAAPSTGYNQGSYHQQQPTRRVVTPPPSQKIVVHQPGKTHHDEAPPSYHQVANPSASANPYAYQEPTEV